MKTKYEIRVLVHITYKNWVTLLLLVFFAGNVLGQTKTTLKKRASNSIISTKTVSKGTGYISTAFDLNLMKLPIGFKGINPIELYKSLAVKSTSLQKEEFETTGQFNERQNVETSKPIFGKLNKDSLFVFKVILSKPTFSEILSYNADMEMLTVDTQLEFAKITGQEYDFSKKSITLKEVSKKERYIGTNAFGTSMKVTKINSEMYQLLIENWKDLEDKTDKYNLANIKYQFQVNINTAKQVKQNNGLGCLFIGKLSLPYSYTGYYYSGPATIDSPIVSVDNYKYINMTVTEIWYYNTITGEILAKNKI